MLDFARFAHFKQPDDQNRSNCLNNSRQSRKSAGENGGNIPVLIKIGESQPKQATFNQMND